jgi:deoxyribodipyrimidine photo-lyase
MTSAAVVLFNRDLRVHDHEGLREAARTHDRLVPLFVLDDRLLDPRAANRLSFLLDSLADLRDSLRERGSDLVVRRGDPVAETLRIAGAVGARAVFTSADSSAYARSRERGLLRECERAGVELRVDDATSVVPPGDVAPEGRDHYRVFTPYWRRWREVPLRPVEAAPERVPRPGGVEPGALPSLRDLTRVTRSRGLIRGGETAGRRRLDAWLGTGMGRYEEDRDQLAPGATSGLSADLHFGCLSPVEVVARAREHGDAFVRQLCWRDFFGQLLAANPQLQREDLHTRGHGWRDDDDALAAWREGGTGYPIVDAAMRQLAREGWMPNRARLIVGSFLSRTLELDWRLGADVFFELLVDGDVANNVGNWQWVAGTGSDTRRSRVLNPVRQAERFDPEGRYVRRYVPELAGLDCACVHEPWNAEPGVTRGYPERIVDHSESRLRRPAHARGL